MPNHSSPTNEDPGKPTQPQPEKKAQARLLNKRLLFLSLALLLIILIGASIWSVRTIDRSNKVALSAVNTTTPNSTALDTTTPPKTTLPPGTPAPASQPISALVPSPEWFVEEIDPQPNVGIFTSLMMGPDGTLYAAYFDDNNDAIKLATKTDLSWTPQPVIDTTQGKDGWYPSIAFDAQGLLHLSYYSNSDQAVIYSSRSGSGDWSFEIAGSGINALDTSLVIGPDNVPHILFFDVDSNEVRYLTKPGEAWISSTVAAGDKEGFAFPIGLDKNNQIHAVFKGTSGGLFYATLNGDNWQVEPIDQGSDTGAYPALAFDGDGLPHISYYDPANQDLKYAHWDGQKWLTEIVDQAGSVGSFTSIAVDIIGNIHISYYDEEHSALKYAFGSAGQWKSSIIDDAGDVGKYNSLALDQRNNPHISYFNESARTLQYAFADIYQRDAEASGHLFATHRSGQTFLTWLEKPDLANERYHIYRSDQPINTENIHQAKLLAQVGENSAKVWANLRIFSDWGARVTNTFVIEDNAAPLGKGVGAFVWTVAPDDFGGNSNGVGYYAVTIVENGSTEQFYTDYQTGPVQEAVSDPEPVEITHSPGITSHAGPGGHYYLQYMDLRHWNPTFHTPNSTNEFYGLDPQSPGLKDALAYTYDYSIYEPTPELCDGSVPDTLPVMIFLHGARGNRYGAPEQYPYPNCAYGVYPIDQSETWYFGFARQHDYRSESLFSPDDVIENYTEQRILRIIYDLIRKPPGPAVDTQRVYLFGHSMGGTGSLAFAERYPNVFAAIYSGQPVTQFYATEGYNESWPTNMAKKWGPHELNLPIAIAGPNHWADHLQTHNGTGIFEWEDLRSAFDPTNKLNRFRYDMVPFGIDHGTIDDAVLFPTQGQPLYPLLNGSSQAWAGAITESTHEWSFFGWPLANLATENDVPFWNFSVIRDETVPGFSFLSGNLVDPPTSPTRYNQTILWSSSWNAWDGAPVDSTDEWQMSFCTVEAGSQSCGGVPAVVDITPRRLQNFVPSPGKSYTWENRGLRDNQLIASGTVLANEYGIITVPRVEILPEGNRLSIHFP